MDSIEPHDVAPDPEPEKPRFRLERIEAALIGLLLLLIAAGNLIPHLLPGRIQYPITVHHTAKTVGLPPVDWSATPVPPKVVQHDLNTATRADLIDLPGIGPSLADSILAYREKHGPYGKIEDLDQVTGIGVHKLESFRQFLFVAENGANAQPTITSATPMLASSIPPLAASPIAAGAVVTRLNLNTATLEQLMALPGIGEGYAKRILDRRRQLGRFRNWAEVSSVPGVGPKRLENIQRYATIH